MQKKKSNESEQLYGELGQAFNFTQGDLEANRAGFLSFRQKQDHKNRAWAFAMMIAIPAIILIIIMGLIVAVNISQQNDPSYSLAYATPVPPIVLICFFLPIFLLILVWIVGMSAYHNYHQLDLQEIRIEKIEGQIRQIQGSEKQVRVGTEDLNSRIKYEDYLWGDSTYLVYYLPREKQIVSIEAIISQ